MVDPRTQRQVYTGVAAPQDYTTQSTRGTTARPVNQRNTAPVPQQTSTRGATARPTNQRNAGPGFGPQQPSSPLPEWTPDMSGYPQPTQPEGGILYDTSFLEGGPSYTGGRVSMDGAVDAVPYDELGPYTREVGEEETVQNQLQGLLAQDSPYMEQARMAGERAAAQRGALSSSMFAGSSQAAAIQAALPIAAQDAQTYSRVASENALAINNNTMAKMDSMTRMAQTALSANAQITTANIGAAAQRDASRISAQTNMEVARMKIVSDQDARAFMAAHDQVMSAIQHGQTIELANLDYGFRTRLMQAGFEHDINMSQLDFGEQQLLMEITNEHALDQIGYRGDVESYLTNQQLRGSFLNTGMQVVMNNIASLGTQGLDAAAFQSASNKIWEQFGEFIGMFNDLNSGGFNFDWGGGN